MTSHWTVFLSSCHPQNIITSIMQHNHLLMVCLSTIMDFTVWENGSTSQSYVLNSSQMLMYLTKMWLYFQHSFFLIFANTWKRMICFQWRLLNYLRWPPALEPRSPSFFSLLLSSLHSSALRFLVLCLKRVVGVNTYSRPWWAHPATQMTAQASLFLSLRGVCSVTATGGWWCLMWHACMCVSRHLSLEGLDVKMG